MIDRALATNIKAIFLLTGLLAPAMAERGSGAIINVGSINGTVGMAHSALYSATKAAIHSLTKSWAAEYGPSGVRVNTVGRRSPRYWLPTPTGPNRSSSALHRSARAHQRIAAAVAFLASDNAANIHGATLSVDGGLMAV